MHSPVSLRHARLLNFVDSLLRIHVERFDPGTVFREVVAVRLSSRNVFLLDLAFYRRIDSACNGTTTSTVLLIWRSRC